jgi:TetR/AcrR family transcriptional repressor of nem operon
MRYPREHKEQTRQRLVERAGRLAKERGFAASGIDAMAAASGVTSGSLYKHFSGKSELFAAIVKAELQRSAERFDHPARGCALPSLTAEVARSDESVRAAFEEGLLDIHEALAPLLKSGDKAWALIAQSVGAVMLARAVPGDEVRGKILAAVRRNGRELLEQEPARGKRR